MQNKRFGLRGRTAMLALLVGVLGLAGSARAAQTIGNFSYGQMQSATVGAKGCGTNAAGEPAIHVSRDEQRVSGSELGVGGGSELWRGLGASAAPARQGARSSSAGSRTRSAAPARRAVTSTWRSPARGTRAGTTTCTCRA